jgi:hypothetical protein
VKALRRRGQVVPPGRVAGPCITRIQVRTSHVPVSHGALVGISAALAQDLVNFCFIGPTSDFIGTGLSIFMVSYPTTEAIAALGDSVALYNQQVDNDQPYSGGAEVSLPDNVRGHQGGLAGLPLVAVCSPWGTTPHHCCIWTIHAAVPGSSNLSKQRCTMPSMRIFATSLNRHWIFCQCTPRSTTRTDHPNRCRTQPFRYCNNFGMKGPMFSGLNRTGRWSSGMQRSAAALIRVREPIMHWHPAFLQ